MKSINYIQHTMKSKLKVKEKKLLKFMNEKESEFEKYLKELETKPVPTRQCSIEDEDCESCGA